MQITTRDLNNNIVVFDLDGELRRSDLDKATLHQEVKAELERARKNIVLDFSRVPFIDSFGVGEILASYISTQNIGGRFKLACVSPKIRVIFKVTKLEDVLEIFDSVDSALRSFDRAE